MKHFKITVSIFLIILAVFTLAGCDRNFFPRGSEITEFEIVRIVGIDQSEENPDHVEITIISERAMEAPGEGFGGVFHDVASATGKTAFEAVSKLRTRLDKKQTFGYVDYIIFGEDAVSDNLAKYADYPARSPEFRFSPKVFAVRGSSAKEFLNVSSSADMFVLDSLDNLKQNINNRSDVKLVRYIELMNMLDHKDVAVILPAISAQEPEDEKFINGEMPEKKLVPAGYAVVRDFKLVGWFDADNAQGYNFLTDSVKTCVQSIKDGYGGYVALDVLGAGSSVKAQFTGDELTKVTFHIDVNAGIAEQHTLMNLQTKENVDYLSTGLARAIENEVREVLSKSKEFGIDCFNLAGRLQMRHPYRWRRIEQDWREIYNDLDIDVVVDARVRRVYNLREPSGYDMSTYN